MCRFDFTNKNKDIVVRLFRIAIPSTIESLFQMRDIFDYNKDQTICILHIMQDKYFKNKEDAKQNFSKFINSKNISPFSNLRDLVLKTRLIVAG